VSGARVAAAARTSPHRAGYRGVTTATKRRDRQPGLERPLRKPLRQCSPIPYRLAHWSRRPTSLRVRRQLLLRTSSPTAVSRICGASKLAVRAVAKEVAMGRCVHRRCSLFADWTSGSTPAFEKCTSVYFPWLAPLATARRQKSYGRTGRPHVDHAAQRHRPVAGHVDPHPISRQP